MIPYRRADECACPRIEHGTVKAPFLLSPQRNSREFFCRRDGAEVHLPCLTDFKENKFCPAIDYRFVPGEKIQTQNAIDVAASST